MRAANVNDVRGCATAAVLADKVTTNGVGFRSVVGISRRLASIRKRRVPTLGNTMTNPSGASIDLADSSLQPGIVQ